MSQRTNPWRAPILIAAIPALATACTSPSIDPGGPQNRGTSIGEVLADSKGMTLYTFDEDSPGNSTCNGLCAVAWPPAEAVKTSTPKAGFSIVKRDDGSLQWAYKDMPLYGYFKDSRPGDITGEGVDGTWHAARP